MQGEGKRQTKPAHHVSIHRHQTAGRNAGRDLFPAHIGEDPDGTAHTPRFGKLVRTRGAGRRRNLQPRHPGMVSGIRLRGVDGGQRLAALPDALPPHPQGDQGRLGDARPRPPAGDARIPPQRARNGTVPHHAARKRHLLDVRRRRRAFRNQRADNHIAPQRTARIVPARQRGQGHGRRTRTQRQGQAVAPAPPPAGGVPRCGKTFLRGVDTGTRILYRPAGGTRQPGCGKGDAFGRLRTEQPETAFRTTPGNAPKTARAKGRDRTQDGTVTSWKRKTGRAPATAPQQLGRKAVTEPKPGRAKAGARHPTGHSRTCGQIKKGQPKSHPFSIPGAHRYLPTVCASARK